MPTTPHGILLSTLLLALLHIVPTRPAPLSITGAYAPVHLIPGSRISGTPPRPRVTAVVTDDGETQTTNFVPIPRQLPNTTEDDDRDDDEHPVITGAYAPVHILPAGSLPYSGPQPSTTAIVTDDGVAQTTDFVPIPRDSSPSSTANRSTPSSSSEEEEPATSATVPVNVLPAFAFTDSSSSHTIAVPTEENGTLITDFVPARNATVARKLMAEMEAATEKEGEKLRAGLTKAGQDMGVEDGVSEG